MDLFDGPGVTEFQLRYIADVGSGFEPPISASEVTSADWLGPDAAIFTHNWGVAPEVDEWMTVDGLPARLLAGHIDDAVLGPAYCIVADIYRGPHAFSVHWYSAPGSEDADLELMHEVLETFQASAP